MPRGTIITITGSDGSGKATQTRLLVERARSEGYKVQTLSFPQYDKFWGKIIRAYLQGTFGCLEDISPYDASMLFALDRLSAREQILRWLAEGYNIIFDRYIESNYGHQASRFKGEEREKMLRWLYELEVKQNKMPESDLVLYLDLPVEWTLKAIEGRNKTLLKKGEENKDIHESDAEYLLATQETYRMLISRNKNWISVPCLKKIDSEMVRYTEAELSEIIWKIVRPYLK